jgi:hypothetical protein
MFGFANAAQISAAALLVYGLGAYGQSVDSKAVGNFITFDAPGVSNTYAVAVNGKGEILGYTYTPGVNTGSPGVQSGFIRGRNGSFSSFDVPGASGYTFDFYGQGSSGSAINLSGVVTGAYYYYDGGSVYHGFVRDNHGTITTLDAPGAGTTAGLGTFATSINRSGEITGSYLDSNALSHGFFRDANGKVTTFDVPVIGTPCAGTGAIAGTFPSAINWRGEITGAYYDSPCHSHGFLRHRNGAFTVVDDPSDPASEVRPLTINWGGAIAGFEYSGGATHGFTRDQRGSFTRFDILRQFWTISCCSLMDLNSAGILVGSYFDGNYASHGFLRLPDGTLSILDVPAAGVGFHQGTYVSSVGPSVSESPSVEITGYYVDGNGFAHGFLFHLIKKAL